MKCTKSKKMQAAYERYKRSTTTQLWQVYGRYSNAKEKALDYCKTVSANLSGTTPYIISYNCNFFSVAFFGELEGKEIFVYITPFQDYYCYSEDLDI